MTFRMLAERYGWGPEQVLDLTDDQLAMYLSDGRGGAPGGMSRRDTFWDAWGRRGLCGRCGEVRTFGKPCGCGGAVARPFGDEEIAARWEAAQAAAKTVPSKPTRPGRRRPRG